VTIRIAAAVAHGGTSDPQRRAWVNGQLREIPNLHIVKGRTGPGELWPTYRRTYLQLWTKEPTATHHLILADDMTPCRNFLQQLHRALAARPHHLVVLFTMKNIVRRAAERGHTWATTAGAAWGGAMAWPATWTGEFIPWADRHVRHDYKHDDGRVVRFLHDHNRNPMWHTAPSLLQHEGAGASLANQNNPRRVAAWFEDDPGHIDWTAPHSPPHDGSIPPAYLRAWNEGSRD
jgi:hypothetical protein